MRLLVYSGSPRRKTGNTRVFVDQILAGWREVETDKPEVVYLYPDPLRTDPSVSFASADIVLIAMPLYVDAMPSGVMEFIAALAPVRNLAHKPALAFFVQSGFPEACHSRPFEIYLEKLARRLECPYLGTIVRGGGEGIKDQPPAATRRLFADFRKLGSDLARTGAMDATLLRKIAGVERFNAIGRVIIRLIIAPLIGRLFWTAQMKKNGVAHLARRQPHADAVRR
jgi:hypothetical protein